MRAREEEAAQAKAELAQRCAEQRRELEAAQRGAEALREGQRQVAVQEGGIWAL